VKGWFDETLHQYRGSIPDGHFNFLHLWPGQIPPPRSDRCG
jgi:hypothetical protein